MSLLKKPFEAFMAAISEDQLVTFMQEMTFTAMGLAELYHGVQRYGDEPYFNHVFDAANLARHMGYNTQTVMLLLLHDIIEDTGMTLVRLRAAGMPPSVVDAVDALTFIDEIDNPDGLEGELRRQLKIAKAMRTPLSQVGKFCDSSVNFGHTVNFPWTLRLDKLDPREYALDYVPNLTDLAIDLPTPEEVKAYTDEADWDWYDQAYLCQYPPYNHGGRHIPDHMPHWQNSRWTRVESCIAKQRARSTRRVHWSGPAESKASRNM